ncbi:hypothetical protein MPER_10927, partial [Moniliophthora perniciosa FA553]
ISGEVYDATEYLREHPGGEDSIVISQGEDATEDFMAIHSIDAKEKLRQFHIGTLESFSGPRGTESLAPAPTVAVTTSRTKASEDTSQAFLNPKKWKSLDLTEIIRSNYNTYTFRFALDHLDQELGLPAGQHVFIRLRSRKTGELVQRAYTPISSTDEKGKIDFLIKIYFPSAQFPQGGKMTMCFHDLTVGQTVEVKGPFGSFTWKGSSTIMYKTISRVVKDVGLVCAGSGITPIFQILTYIMNRESETDSDIRLWVLYANRTEDDILCREQLESFLALAPKRFKLYYTLSTISGIPRNWRYGKGKVDEVMLRKHLPPPSQNGVILACGPDPMMEKTLKPCLGRIGWDINTSLVVF